MILQTIDPFVGRYYSMEWVKKNVLQLDDDEIAEIAKQIEEEAAANAPTDAMGNPMQVDPMTGQPIPQPGVMPGQVPPTPQEAMMQQQQQPVQDGTGKDQMDPMAQGQNNARRRFTNDTMEPVR